MLRMRRRRLKSAHCFWRCTCCEDDEDDAVDADASDRYPGRDGQAMRAACSHRRGFQRGPACFVAVGLVRSSSFLNATGMCMTLQQRANTGKRGSATLHDARSFVYKIHEDKKRIRIRRLAGASSSSPTSPHALKRGTTLWPKQTAPGVLVREAAHYSAFCRSAHGGDDTPTRRVRRLRPGRSRESLVAAPVFRRYKR